ncbi:MAG: HAMP domain-containing sensor histidine kinase [Gemmataceae bacterium]
MDGATVGRSAIELPWLRPSDRAILALADDRPSVAGLLTDPAMIAHVFRFTRPTPGPGDDPFTPASLTQPALCTAAAELVTEQSADRGDGFEPALRVAELAAGIAYRLADLSGDVPPRLAASVCRLAPLGWFAVASVNPAAALDCYHDPNHKTSPLVEQRNRWGLESGSIARRLAARWRLPEWLTATMGSLQHHPDDAVRAGASGGLFRVVQSAVHAAERAIGLLGIAAPPPDTDLATTADRLAQELMCDPVQTRAGSTLGHSSLLLARLLRACAAARRANGTAWLAEAEDRFDRVCESLRAARQDQSDALRDAKLAGLAEFAAGASHEINNPIAVIAGHAQLLLSHEEDAERRKQLNTIIRQTARVRDLLHGTRQFARPPKPAAVSFPAADLVVKAVEEVQSEADRKGVAVRSVLPPEGTAVQADPAQAGQALTQLLLNAVQAAPTGGWVQVQVCTTSDRLTVVVEDSGHGPDPDQVPYLFDPFFCGRSAGRGRGLGLSIAWRLTRINGGDVNYEPLPGRPSRFTLTLPSAVLSPVSYVERLSA